MYWSKSTPSPPARPNRPKWGRARGPPWPGPHRSTSSPQRPPNKPSPHAEPRQNGAESTPYAVPLNPTSAPRLRPTRPGDRAHRPPVLNGGPRACVTRRDKEAKGRARSCWSRLSVRQFIDSWAFAAFSPPAGNRQRRPLAATASRFGVFEVFSCFQHCRRSNPPCRSVAVRNFFRGPAAAQESSRASAALGSCPTGYLKCLTLSHSVPKSRKKTCSGPRTGQELLLHRRPSAHYPGNLKA